MGTLITLLTLLGTLSADDILERADRVLTAPKDSKSVVEVILIDRKGREEKREMVIYQKGKDKRLVKFTKPASKKGIGFLVLPDDIMYLYLPAYKKVRRIASHIKNQNFAGTDFSYEDIASKGYAKEWIPYLVEEKDSLYILKLTPKEGVKKSYSKLLVFIRKDNFYPVRVEFYSKTGKKIKVMKSRSITKVKNYWIAKEAVMYDLKKKHKTVLKVKSVEFDIGLSDSIFTKRFLMRG